MMNWGLSVMMNWGLSVIMNWGCSGNVLRERING